MVKFFFVLSGFLIFSKYSLQIHSLKDLINFQKIRFARIYPLHILFLIIFLILEIAKYIASEIFQIKSPNSTPFFHNNLIAFFQHIFLIQAIGPTGNSLTFNIPSWSISVEFYTYMLFGVFTLFFKKIGILILSVITLLSAYFVEIGNLEGFRELAECLAGFCTGCIIAMVCKSSPKVPKESPTIIFMFAIFFLCYKDNPMLDSVFYILSALLILSISQSPRASLSMILSSRPLIFLGYISYSLYMCHSSVIWISNQVARIFISTGAELANQSGLHTPQLTRSDTTIMVFFMLPLCIVISWYLHKFIEEPWRRKLRKPLY